MLIRARLLKAVEAILFLAQQCVLFRYDFFLADDRIIPLLPKLLGKSFFIKKRCAPQHAA